MSFPAARVTDMHVCPMVTGVVPHVGGPILPPGVPTVLIAGLPAATVSSMAVCAGPPDLIVKGSPTVLIASRPAARMTDSCAHGGMIVAGCPTVLIGDQGSSNTDPARVGQALTMQAAKGAALPFTKLKCDEVGAFAAGVESEPSTTESRRINTWIEIELVDEDGLPIAGERYRVTAPDGEQFEGTVDGNGRAKVWGVEPGTCKISFPDLDSEAWRPQGSHG